MTIKIYTMQEQGAEMIVEGNELVRSDNKDWHALSSQPRGLASIPFTETVVIGKLERFLVWSSYRVFGRWTTNRYVAKAYLVLSRLAGEGDFSALVAICTPITGEPEAARAVLYDFAESYALELFK